MHAKVRGLNQDDEVPRSETFQRGEHGRRIHGVEAPTIRVATSGRSVALD
jgi:hypothetical protein